MQRSLTILHVEDTQMGNKYMKIHFISYLIKEFQIATLKCHINLLEGYEQNTNHTKC
jgi:hypothetical protein